jgi:hypothetical protein
VRVSDGLRRLRIRSNDADCEHVNRIWGFISGREILDQLTEVEGLSAYKIDAAL